MKSDDQIESRIRVLNKCVRVFTIVHSFYYLVLYKMIVADGRDFVKVPIFSIAFYNHSCRMGYLDREISLKNVLRDIT